MMATAADSMGDVITTGATIASVLFFYFTGINIDGYVGLGVSLVVMWPVSESQKIRWSH